MIGKVDLHTHVLPEKLPDLESRYGVHGFVQLAHTSGGCAKLTIDGAHCRDIDSRSWDPKRRIEDCDRHGVQLQVLSTVPVLFSYWAPAEAGLDLARLLNDHIAALVRDYPGRFAGLGTVPLQDPDRAILELERCMGPLGLAGVEIGTHVNDWNLDDPRLFPWFSRCRELDAAIFVHPWEMMGRERMPRFMLPWLVGMPAETSLAACSLVLGGVLDRLPGLKVCLAHGGGAFPWTLGRISHAWSARPDLCAVQAGADPRQYAKHFYYDSLLHDPEALRFLLRQVGVERVGIGSDYPFPLGESIPGSLAESLAELTDSDRERLSFGTAREFLARGDPQPALSSSGATRSRP